jgi:hypothetical protein
MTNKEAIETIKANYPDERYTMLREALDMAMELLKAQEPMVMTLEEVKNSEVLYFEDFTDISDGVKPIIRPAINIEVKNGGIVMLDSEMWDDGFTFSTDEEYGKTWRCWTSRPTDEQRKETQWSEPPKEG